MDTPRPAAGRGRSGRDQWSPNGALPNRVGPTDKSSRFDLASRLVPAYEGKPSHAAIPGADDNASPCPDTEPDDRLGLVKTGHAVAAFPLEDVAHVHGRADGTRQAARTGSPPTVEQTTRRTRRLGDPPRSAPTTGEAALRPALYRLRRPSPQAVLALAGDDRFRFRPTDGDTPRATAPPARQAPSASSVGRSGVAPRRFRAILAAYAANHHPPGRRMPPDAHSAREPGHGPVAVRWRTPPDPAPDAVAGARVCQFPPVHLLTGRPCAVRRAGRGSPMSIDPAGHSLADTRSPRARLSHPDLNPSRSPCAADARRHPAPQATRPHARVRGTRDADVRRPGTHDAASSNLSRPRCNAAFDPGKLPASHRALNPPHRTGATDAQATPEKTAPPDVRRLHGRPARVPRTTPAQTLYVQRCPLPTSRWISAYADKRC